MASRRTKSEQSGIQMSLFLPETKPQKMLMFGGSLLKGHAKIKRPISLKHAMHVVLRSSQARGAKSLLNFKHVDRIHCVIEKQAKASGIKIYRCENVGNHIHLVLKIYNRELFFKFLRAISGVIARIATGAEKNHAVLDQSLRFWDSRPFSRIVEWGRSFKNLMAYMDKNAMQAIGFDMRSITTLCAINSS